MNRETMAEARRKVEAEKVLREVEQKADKLTFLRAVLRTVFFPVALLRRAIELARNASPETLYAGMAIGAIVLTTAAELLQALGSGDER